MKNLFDKISQLIDDENYEDAVSLFEAADASLKDPDTTSLAAVAYNNLSDGSGLETAVMLLLSVKNDVTDKFRLYYRLGYAYCYLDENENAIEAFDHSLALFEEGGYEDKNNIRSDIEYMKLLCEADREIDGEDDAEGFAPTMYSEEDMDIVENAIKERFGDFGNVFHEIVSPDIHLDICVIEPTDTRNYYTLTTLGMGAHKMNTPDNLKDVDRAELAIHLPANWDITADDPNSYWPIEWLKILGRLPINNNTWLGLYHTVPCGSAVSKETELSGFLIDNPLMVSDIDPYCTLSTGERVNFFTIVPIHEAEMSFKVDNGAESLVERFQDGYKLVDLGREAVVEEGEVLEGVIDLAAPHIAKIFDKELPLDPINGFNHLALYLRWAIENDLVHPKFHEVFGDVIEDVLNGNKHVDLRVFLHEEFDGRIFDYLFNDEGYRFTYLYNDYEWDFLYPRDVDTHAFEYFGGRKEEMLTEEYLFVPYGDEYYNGIKKFIDRAYAVFKEQD